MPIHAKWSIIFIGKSDYYQIINLTELLLTNDFTVIPVKVPLPHCKGLLWNPAGDNKWFKDSKWLFVEYLNRLYVGSLISVTAGCLDGWRLISVWSLSRRNRKNSWASCWLCEGEIKCILDNLSAKYYVHNWEGYLKTPVPLAHILNTVFIREIWMDICNN